LSNNYIIYLYNLTLIYRSYVLLYSGPIYPYLPILHTLICRSYILLYADPIYPYMPALYTLICRAYILIYTLICRPFILLYACLYIHIYSYMLVLYTLICRSCNTLTCRRGPGGSMSWVVGLSKNSYKPVYA
jgi:hypothetical protein